VDRPLQWSWEEFLSLPSREYVVDISCVTKWTHLDMRWQGVSLDTLLEGVQLDDRAAFVIAECDGGYTTNLPLGDVLNNQSFVAYEYTAATGISTLHRNVIFRNERVPFPTTYYEQPTPQGLWAELANTCTDSGTGCDALILIFRPQRSCEALILKQNNV